MHTQKRRQASLIMSNLYGLFAIFAVFGIFFSYTLGYEEKKWLICNKFV